MGDIGKRGRVIVVSPSLRVFKSPTSGGELVRISVAFVVLVPLDPFPLKSNTFLSHFVEELSVFDELSIV